MIDETRERIIEEIMSKEPNGSVSLFESLSIISKYSNSIKLLMNDKYEPYYSINLKNLFENELSVNDLTDLRNAYWEYNKDNSTLTCKVTI